MRSAARAPGLAEMTNLGIPVPPGFTIATGLCIAYIETGQFPPWLRTQVEAGIQRLEADTNRGFGGQERPLLVAVRSGAPVSMPGMMDTILNLGLNDTTVEGLATETGNASFAWDSYRRFVQMYSTVVLGLPMSFFEQTLEAAKRKAGLKREIDLSVADLQVLVDQFKEHGRSGGRTPLPR